MWWTVRNRVKDMYTKRNDRKRYIMSVVKI